MRALLPVISGIHTHTHTQYNIQSSASKSCHKTYETSLARLYQKTRCISATLVCTMRYAQSV